MWLSGARAFTEPKLPPGITSTKVRQRFRHMRLLCWPPFCPAPGDGQHPNLAHMFARAQKRFRRGLRKLVRARRALQNNKT